jgi:hypothetical protein
MFKVLSPNELLADYRKIVTDLLPDFEYSKEVSEEETNRELDLLKNTLHNQRFIFVINLHKMEIENCKGIERWLGYPDMNFTLFDYLKIIHPSHNVFHQITSKLGISGLMRGDYPIEFMKHRLVTFIPLRHRNGKYFFFKRVGSVFQYFKNKNSKHCLLEYINEFTLLKEFDETPGAITTFAENITEKQWEDKILTDMKKVFEKESVFSLQEYRVLRDYAYNSKAQVTDIAKKLGVKTSSVITYHKRILNKAEQLLSIKFSTVKDVAAHLRGQELI